MKVYWVSFSGAGRGCGMTAIDEKDCRSLVEGIRFFEGRSVTSITKIRSVEELDQNHVVPNMGNMLMHGVWFPDGI